MNADPENGTNNHRTNLAVNTSSDDKFNTLLATMPCAFFYLNKKGIVKMISYHAELLFAIKKEDLIGKSYEDVFTQSSYPDFKAAIHQAITENIDTKSECIFFHPQKWVSATVTPVKDGITIYLVDITEFKEKEVQIHELIEHTPDVITRWDRDLKLVFANSAYVEKNGMPLESLIGKTNTEIGQPDEVALPYIEKLKLVIASKTAQTHYNSYSTAKGEVFFFSRLVPEFYLDGSVKTVLATARDITELKTAEAEIRQLLRNKDEFLSTASHELKTPLTSIKAHLQFLQRLLNEEKAVMHTNKALANLVKMDRLIKDLLDVSKISTGKINYNKEAFNFDFALKDWVAEMQQSETKHEIILDLNADVEVHGDKVRLEQVVVNYLLNAIKFSPEANMVFIRSELKDGQVLISVRDVGIGINEADIPQLFDRFFRVNKTAMHYRGLGLGLYIASRILEAHNATYWVESTQGQGSVFYFSMPQVA